MSCVLLYKIIMRWKCFKLMSLSDTLWLAYIIDIQQLTMTIMPSSIIISFYIMHKTCVKITEWGGLFCHIKQLSVVTHNFMTLETTFFFSHQISDAFNICCPRDAVSRTANVEANSKPGMDDMSGLEKCTSPIWVTGVPRNNGGPSKRPP